MSFLNWSNFNKDSIGKHIKTDTYNGVISRRFRRWHRLVEVFFLFLAVCVSAYSAFQTKKALDLNIEEFDLRNRPYVILKDLPNFGEGIKYPTERREGDKVVYKGPYEYKKTINIFMQNISEIPAQNVVCTVVLYLDALESNRSGIYPPICLAKGSDPIVSIGLEQNQYDAFIAGSIKLSVKYTIKYSDTFKKNFETNVNVEFEPDFKNNRVRVNFLEYVIK